MRTRAANSSARVREQFKEAVADALGDHFVGMDRIGMAFGSKVKELREGRGWSIKKVSEITGIKWITLADIEQAGMLPPSSTVPFRRLLTVFGVNESDTVELMQLYYGVTERQARL